MKKLLLTFCALMLCALGFAQLNPPINENFDGDFPPTNWTQQQFVGSQTWTKGTNPTMIRGAGAAYAMISQVSTTALISPAIDIPASGNFKLTFWTKFMFPDLNASYEVWISKTNNTDASAFTVLKTLGGSDEISEADWKEIVVNLPDEYNGETVYIAFVTSTETAGFYAWAVDDFELLELTSDPVFFGDASLNMGTAYNNVPYPTEKDYTITNKGGSTLTISAFSSENDELSIATSLPLNIEPNESKTLKVLIDANTETLPIGAYSGNFKITTNDPNKSEASIDVSATVASAIVSNYLEEGFNTSSSLPTGWATMGFNRDGGSISGFAINNGVGISSSNALRINLHNGARRVYAKTPYINMGNNPILSFNYKVTNWVPAGVATPAENFDMMVRITKDNGTTWDTTLDLGTAAHTPSADYTLKNVNVNAFANEVCIVEIWFYWAAGDFYVDIDDITAGTPPANELAATSISGNAIPTMNTQSTYTVVVRNNGTTNQDNTTYSVKFMQEGDVEIATLPGVSIAYGETKSFDFNWTPNTESATYFYGEVVMVTDEDMSNNRTSNFNVYVQPAGITGITIDEGTATTNAPVNFQYAQSVSQTLYPSYEIGSNGGIIKGLIYKTKLTAARANETVKVYVGETDKIDFSDYQKIDPTTLTLAFDGTLNFSATDGAELVIPFNTPYNYEGRTLVVCVYRPVATAYTAQDVFYAKTLSTYRTLVSGYIASGSADPMGYDFINSIIGVSPTYNNPMVTLLMDLSDAGSLSGVVSDENGVLEGATVALVDEPLSITTNAAGEYIFPHVMSGTYTMEVSKFGYVTQTIDITITAGNDSIKNVLMPVVTEFPVSGNITGSNAPGGVENVKVLLRGYENYTATTDASGDYEFPAVYNGKYEIRTVVGGYLEYVDSIEVDDAALTHDIVLTEIPYPVLNASAEVSSDDVVIKWNTPEPVSTFRYDAGNADGQFGFSSGNQNGVMGSVHRINSTLNKMSWYLTGIGGIQTQVNVFVFDLDSNGQPTNTILYSKANVSTKVNEWCSHEFDAPVEAPNGFMIALSRNSGFLSLGTSNATGEYPFAPLTHFYSGNYNTMAFSAIETTEGSPNFSFMIRAEGESYGQVVTKGNIATPAPDQYIVYRLEYGDDEATWEEIATTPDTAYTDTDWAGLTGGKLYQYAVKAEYVNDNISSAVLTNVLPKEMETSYTVNITTNSGDAVNGAIVELINQDGYTAHTYTQTATDSVVNFPTVWKGIYNISIKKDGFAPHLSADITIDQDGLSYDTVLIELINAPFGLEIDVEGTDATFSWNNASYTFFDDMEGHADFAIQNIGEYTLYDGDNEPTFSNYGGIMFTNMGYTGSYIVMNPTQTIPPSNSRAFQAYSGNKYLISFATGTATQNNDWLILPKRKIADGTIFKFFAQNWTMGYDVARLKVGISTSGTAIGDFTTISDGSYVEAPYGGAGVQASWDSFEYDLSAYAGQEVYLAIACVSNDNTSALMLDDISLAPAGVKAISAKAGSSKALQSYTVYLDSEEVETEVNTEEYLFENLSEGEHTAGVQAVYSSGVSTIETINFNVTSVGISVTGKESFTVYPNPVTDILNISTDATIVEITVLDVNGKVVANQKGDKKQIDLSALPTGNYITRIRTENGISSVKVIKK